MRKFIQSILQDGDRLPSGVPTAGFWVIDRLVVQLQGHQPGVFLIKFNKEKFDIEEESSVSFTEPNENLPVIEILTQARDPGSTSTINKDAGYISLSLSSRIIPAWLPTVSIWSFRTMTTVPGTYFSTTWIGESKMIRG